MRPPFPQLRGYFNSPRLASDAVRAEADGGQRIGLLGSCSQEVFAVISEFG
jgi:hypothetical protein